MDKELEILKNKEVKKIGIPFSRLRSVLTGYLVLGI